MFTYGKEDTLHKITNMNIAPEDYTHVEATESTSIHTSLNPSLLKGGVPGWISLL